MTLATAYTAQWRQRRSFTMSYYAVVNKRVIRIGPKPSFKIDDSYLDLLGSHDVAYFPESTKDGRNFLECYIPQNKLLQEVFTRLLVILRDQLKNGKMHIEDIKEPHFKAFDWKTDVSRRPRFLTWDSESRKWVEIKDTYAIASKKQSYIRAITTKLIGAWKSNDFIHEDKSTERVNPQFPANGGPQSIKISSCFSPHFLEELKELEEILNHKAHRSKYEKKAKKINASYNMILDSDNWMWFCNEVHNSKRKKSGDEFTNARYLRDFRTRARENILQALESKFPNVFQRYTLKNVGIISKYKDTFPQPVHADCPFHPQDEFPEVAGSLMISEKGNGTVVIPMGDMPVRMTPFELSLMDVFRHAPYGLLEKIAQSEVFQHFPRLLFADDSSPENITCNRGDMILFHGCEAHYGLHFATH